MRGARVYSDKELSAGNKPLEIVRIWSIESNAHIWTLTYSDLNDVVSFVGEVISNSLPVYPVHITVRCFSAINMQDNVLLGKYPGFVVDVE